MEFAARIRDEMLRARERNELLEEGFFPDNWVWLQEILQDSNRFARTHPERFEVEAPEFCV